jgi:hypothetical protein
MDLVKFLEKNQKIHIQIVASTSRMTSCRTMNKKKKEEMKNQDSMGETKKFLAPYPSAVRQF